VLADSTRPGAVGPRCCPPPAAILLKAGIAMESVLCLIRLRRWLNLLLPHQIQELDAGAGQTGLNRAGSQRL
jgi:hypothetical protein